jgi:hypothetical protein
MTKAPLSIGFLHTGKKYATELAWSHHRLIGTFVVASAARSHWMPIYEMSGKNAKERRI